MAVFVGRQRELTELAGAAVRARQGEPAVVLIEGEAGVGKSALLNHFVSGLSDAMTVRASGDDAKLSLGYGLVSQLVAGAGTASVAPGSALVDLRDDMDALTVGAGLLAVVNDLQTRAELVVVAVDDLHFSDGPSARALLFALRRLNVDRVLAVATFRDTGLVGLGEGWSRFAAGDRWASRIRLGGLGVDEVMELAARHGAMALARRAATRLVQHTGGNPLYCQALLDDVGVDALLSPEALPVPDTVAGGVVARLNNLEPGAQALARAVAVLGGRCELGIAARLARIDNWFEAVDEAAQAGILVGVGGLEPASISFSHPLVRQAIYGDLGLAERRSMHARAAELVGGDRSLAHLVAAAVDADDGLAGVLDRAALDARGQGRPVMAARWLAEASKLSGNAVESDRRLFDALELLLACGEVGQAQALADRTGREPALRPPEPAAGGASTGGWQSGPGRGPSAGGLANPPPAGRAGGGSGRRLPDGSGAAAQWAASGGDRVVPALQRSGRHPDQCPPSGVGFASGGPGGGRSRGRRIRGPHFLARGAHGGSIR